MEAHYTALLSPASPTVITVYPNSFSASPEEAKSRTFRETARMARWFGRDPLKSHDKRWVPFFVRGHCIGHRLKDNLQPPFQIILDVDDCPLHPREVSARLQTFSVGHLWYTTWSHGKRKGYRFRVITDLLADTFDRGPVTLVRHLYSNTWMMFWFPFQIS